MIRRVLKLIRNGVAVLLIAGLTLVAVFAAWVYLGRPDRTSETRVLFQGVEYSRLARSVPRPILIHRTRVDLHHPQVRLLVTPGDKTSGKELPARTTSEFLKEFKLQLAINGSFFQPFHSNTPIDYYPRSGDPVDVIGLSTSNGVTYSLNDGKRSVLCIASHNRVSIQRGSCPADTEQALGGHVVLVSQGRVAKLKPSALEPRTAVGLDKSGRYLYLVVIDGRQPGYSEGVTLQELADLCLELGVWSVLNLDGGGSTTMVVERAFWPRLLNTPIHTRIPMRERPVANHIGVFAAKLDP